MEPKVILLSWTQNPIETIYALWNASKSNDPHINPAETPLSPGVMEIFQKVIDSQIPVAENISFVFLLENVSISFREQMVRHRVGVKVGDRIGMDIVPDLQSSTWWSQSMRILDMGRFADERRYRLPEGLDVQQEAEFVHSMHRAQKAYNDMVKAGVPMEEAREVIPLAATHRISWSLNLTSLQHIIGKRGCQILQLGLWEPIIKGMVNELAQKVHPYFRNLITPPCIKGEKFVGCCFKLDNERRVSGEDKLPPCTLYIGRERPDQAPPADQAHRFGMVAVQYQRLWGRNPVTGEKE